ncbi:gluconokinase [Paracoccus sp. EGI L200073]|nr:gluconokinase [Paracoccus salsus]
MGPSGVGKSTVAAALAECLGAAFIEGDDYHPPENRAAMAAGRPLTDQMRAPWLDALAAAVARSVRSRDTVFSCSALRRSYRDRLRRRIGPVRIIHLTAPPDLIRQRMQARQHFMPPGMLDSQIATLEVPTPDEAAITIDVTSEPKETVRKAVRALGR